MKIIEDEKTLKELTDYWVKVLRLENWEIVTKIKRKEDMNLSECQGEVRYVFVHRQALITLMDPIDWDNKDFEQDMESTLIHELLHLSFANITGEEGELDKFQHQLLCDMEDALMDIKNTICIKTEIKYAIKQ